MKHASILLAMLMLAACSDSTQIQREYDDVRDECRGAAEGNIGQYIPSDAQTDQRDFNAQLTALFSDCMFEKGWTVATPPREGEVADSGWGTSPQHPEILTRSGAAKKDQFDQQQQQQQHQIQQQQLQQQQMRNQQYMQNEQQQNQQRQQAMSRQTLAAGQQGVQPQQNQQPYYQQQQTQLQQQQLQHQQEMFKQQQSIDQQHLEAQQQQLGQNQELLNQQQTGINQQQQLNQQQQQYMQQQPQAWQNQAPVQYGVPPHASGALENSEVTARMQSRVSSGVGTGVAASNRGFYGSRSSSSGVSAASRNMNRQSLTRSSGMYGRSSSSSSSSSNFWRNSSRR